MRASRPEPGGFHRRPGRPTVGGCTRSAKRHWQNRRKPVASWAVQDNPVHKWYHAPWIHYGPRGREFTHGPTRECTSCPGELDDWDRQKRWFRNIKPGEAFDPAAASVDCSLQIAVGIANFDQWRGNLGTVPSRGE